MEETQHFERLIKAHEALIWKVCRIYTGDGTDAKDLFQEIVLQLWQSFPRFRGDSKYTTWMYRVAINTAISGLRRKKNPVDSYAPENLPQPADTTDHAEEQLQALHSAIGQLNEIEKAIVMLYLEDHSYEEMEEILGIRQGHLRVRMSRIKDKLRQLAKKEEYGTR